MKNLLFVLALILSANVFAQNTIENPDVFVRIYDLQGKKINKGRIASITETSLVLTKRGKQTEVPVNTIGAIKTKYSAGNNILIGTLSGAGIGCIFHHPATVAGGAAIGFAVGCVTVLFKNSEYYEIDGDITKFKTATELILAD